MGSGDCIPREKGPWFTTHLNELERGLVDIGERHERLNRVLGELGELRVLAERLHDDLGAARAGNLLGYKRDGTTRIV